MLFLHAADLHLGKTLHERDLGPDQKAMLDGLLAAITNFRPAALLLAGDLYDRSIPPPEAVRLFDSFLSEAVSLDPGLVVVAISGNHDSAARLSFGGRIMSRSGVHIRTSPDSCLEPVIVERGGERAAIWALPYVGAEAFTQALREIAPVMEAARKEQAVSHNLLLAHCFASGGVASESERAFVGAAEQVDALSFEAFDYVALGHLHRFQRAGRTGRYSGSPLAYSFAEAGDAKGFVLVDLKPGGEARAELLPFAPLHAMRRIEGPFSDLAAPGAYAEFREDFIEARLTDAEAVLNPADPLRANFPNLLSVRQAAFELAAPSRPADDRAMTDGAQRTVVDDFALFHAELRGGAPDAELAALFAALAEEAGRETL